MTQFTHINDFSIGTVNRDVDYGPTAQVGYGNDCDATGDWTGSNATITVQGGARIRATYNAGQPSIWLATAFPSGSYIAVDENPYIEILFYDINASTENVDIEVQRADNSSWYTVASDITESAQDAGVDGIYMIDMRDNSNLVGEEIKNIRITGDAFDSGEYFEFSWLRICALLPIPIVQSIAPKSDLRVVRHKILTRDGDVLQILGRDSREFVIRGIFYEYTGYTIENWYDDVECVLAAQVASGLAVFYIDSRRTIEGFAKITFTEDAGNRGDVRVNLIEETNP